MSNDIVFVFACFVVCCRQRQPPKFNVVISHLSILSVEFRFGVFNFYPIKKKTIATIYINRMIDICNCVTQLQ